MKATRIALCRAALRSSSTAVTNGRSTAASIVSEEGWTRTPRSQGGVVATVIADTMALDRTRRASTQIRFTNVPQVVEYSCRRSSVGSDVMDALRATTKPQPDDCLREQTDSTSDDLLGLLRARRGMRVGAEGSMNARVVGFVCAAGLLFACSGADPAPLPPSGLPAADGGQRRAATPASMARATAEERRRRRLASRHARRSIRAR
jgi:hypothetical protein